MTDQEAAADDPESGAEAATTDEDPTAADAAETTDSESSVTDDADAASPETPADEPKSTHVVGGDTETEVSDENPAVADEEVTDDAETVATEEIVDEEGVSVEEASSDEITGNLESIAEDVDEETLEYVRETPEEELAAEIASLRVEIEGLEAAIDDKDDQIEDLKSRLKRTQADFQNYKKRTKRRREEEKQRATENLVERLLDVRDNLRRALEQDKGDVREGVESTLRQFDHVLEQENVEPIEPDSGDEVDPHRHEVLARIESDEPDGTIAEIHRPGYEMADKVLRPAQIAVSENSTDENDE